MVTISQETGLGQAYSRLTEADVSIDKAVFETSSGQVGKTGLPQKLVEADIGLDGAVSGAASAQVAKHRLTKEGWQRLTWTVMELFLRRPVAR